jgi:hypothetical protein
MGCDIANSRRADSVDPTGAGGHRLLQSDGGTVRGRLRKDRASSSTSHRRSNPRFREMRSIRSPCWPVAASVHLPAAPFPLSGPVRRTNRLRPGVPDVADDPVATPAAAVGEVMAAHRLGITREAARQVGGLRRHVAHAAALSPTLPAWGIAFRLSGARHSHSSPAARCTASPSSNMIAPSRSEANQ